MIKKIIIYPTQHKLNYWTKFQARGMMTRSKVKWMPAKSSVPLKLRKSWYWIFGKFL